jgi:hypothetical protein
MTENNTTPATITAVQLGILFGIIMILQFVILYVLDIDPVSNPMVGTVMNVFNYFIIPALMIYLVCTGYKKANFGFISFGECIKKGVSLCVVAGLIYAVFSALFNYFFPEFVEEILRKTRAVMIEKSPEMTAEQVDMALSWTKKFMSPMLIVPVTILMYSLLGLIHSLIIGAIVKKDKPHSI